MKFNIKYLYTYLYLVLCSSCSDQGDSLINTGALILSHNGVDREYLLHVPELKEGSTSYPLLLNFHGYGGTASDHMYSADFRSIADTAGFIVAYPQGLPSDDGSPHWNIAERGGDNKSQSDDFGFINSLIDQISIVHNIDQDRIYASGYSNGAGISFSIACHLDRIAAIASVSGLMSDWAFENCDPPDPVGVMILHGTSDYVRPYNGIDDFALSVNEEIQFWTNFNDTDSIPQVDIINNENSIEHYRYDNGRKNSSVEHYKINGGYHVWFNFDHDGQSTNQLIWNFLSKHSLQ